MELDIMLSHIKNSLKLTHVALLALLFYGCSSNPLSFSGIGASSDTSIVGNLPGVEGLDSIPGMGDTPEKEVEPPLPVFETAAERTQRLEEKAFEMQEQVEKSKDVCAVTQAEITALDHALGDPISEQDLTLTPLTFVGRIKDYGYNLVVETAKGFLAFFQPFIQTKRALLNENQKAKEAEIARKRNEFRRAFLLGQAAGQDCEKTAEATGTAGRQLDIAQENL